MRTEQAFLLPWLDWCFVHASVFDFVSLQLVTDRFHVKTELACSLRFVVAGLFEGFQYQLAFGFRGRYAKRQHYFRRRFRAGISEVRRQMKSLNPLTLGEDQCTLHDVSKFAH